MLCGAFPWAIVKIAYVYHDVRMCASRMPIMYMQCVHCAWDIVSAQ